MAKFRVVLCLLSIACLTQRPSLAQPSDSNQRLRSLAERWSDRTDGVAERTEAKLEQLHADREMGLPTETPNVSPTSSLSRASANRDDTRYLQRAIETEIGTLPAPVRADLDDAAVLIATGFMKRSRTDDERAAAAGYLKALDKAAAEPAAILLRPVFAFVAEDWDKWRQSCAGVTPELASTGRHPYLLAIASTQAARATRRTSGGKLPAATAARLTPLLVESLAATQAETDADFPDRSLHLRGTIDAVIENFSADDRATFFESATEEVITRDLPDYPLAAMLAAAQKEAGWQERGRGFAADVDPAGWPKYEAHMKTARDLTQLAFLSQPNDVTTAALAIRLETYVGMPGTAAEWYSIGSSVQRDSTELAAAYAWSCTPRWGGDTGDLIRFGDALIAAADAGSDGSLWGMTEVLRTLRSIYVLQSQPGGREPRLTDGLRTSNRFFRTRPVADFAAYQSLLADFATAAAKSPDAKSVAAVHYDALAKLSDLLVTESQLEPLGRLVQSGLLLRQSEQRQHRCMRRGLPALTAAREEIIAIHRLCNPYAEEFTPDTLTKITDLVEAARLTLAASTAEPQPEIAAETEAFLADAEFVVREVGDFFSDKPNHGIVVPFDEYGNCGLIASPINLYEVRVQPNEKDKRRPWLTFRPWRKAHPFGVRVDLPLPGPVDFRATLRVDTPPAGGKKYPFGLWVGPDDEGGVLYAISTQERMSKFERLPLSDPDEAGGGPDPSADSFNLRKMKQYRLQLRTGGPKVRALINGYLTDFYPRLLDPPSDHRPLFVGCVAADSTDLRLGIYSIVIEPDRETLAAGN